MRECVLSTGTDVRFRLKDIVCPDRDQLLQNVTERLEVSGKVLYLSDSGASLNHYAVVEVSGMATPVIVPSEAVNLRQTTETAVAAQKRTL